MPEVFRNIKGVERSQHPHFSYAAWGKRKKEIINEHSLEYGLGLNSPLKKLYDIDSYVMLLGVGYDVNTSFHLAEYYNKKSKQIIQGAPLIIEGERAWVEFKDIELNGGDFQIIGKEFEKNKVVKVGKVGNANTIIFKHKDAVDFAKEWMLKNRDYDLD